MARIIKIDGTVENTSDLSFENLQKVVGGDFEEIKILNMSKNKMIIIVNKNSFDGTLLKNNIASIYTSMPTFGNVIICDRKELKQCQSK